MKKFNNPFNLKNKLVFVLGGSGLIGSKLCIFLNNLNARVIVIDKKKSSIFDKNSNIKFKKFDFKNVTGLKNLLENLIAEFGTPDSFVNCSYPKTSDWNKNNFENIKFESYKKNISLHLDSYIWSSKIIADAMKRKKKGSIILFNSIYGLVGQAEDTYTGTKIKENMTYSIIKGALTNFVKQMASFYGKYNIRINNICCGGIEENNIQQNKRFKKNYINKTPLKRLGNTNDLTGAVAYLISDSSSYVTGTNLVIDGGWTAI